MQVDRIRADTHRVLELLRLRRACGGVHVTAPVHQEPVTARLGVLLQHADMRVRLKTQFELVRRAGYLPVLFFDTPPLGNDDGNFTRGFAGWQWVRGQHADRVQVVRDAVGAVERRRQRHEDVVQTETER